MTQVMTSLDSVNQNLLKQRNRNHIKGKANKNHVFQSIVEQCKEFKGDSQGEISKETEQIKTELGIQMMKQKLQQQKTVQTVDKLYNMSNNLPNILSTIYVEDRLRLKDSVEDERAVL